MKKLFLTTFKKYMQSFFRYLICYLAGAGIVFYAAVVPKAGLFLLAAIIISIILFVIAALRSSYKTIKTREKYKILFSDLEDFF